MAEKDPQAYSNWVVRCAPNLVQDEWLNVGLQAVQLTLRLMPTV